MPSVNSQTFAVPEGSESEDHSESGSSHAGSSLNETALDVVVEQFTAQFNPARLDRSMAQQSQLSGQMNAKQREVDEAITKVTQRLEEMKRVVADGQKNVKQVNALLEKCAKKTDKLQAETKSQFPIEYAQAGEKYSDH